MPFLGSCLCKAVQYEVEVLDTPIGHCHCNTCRKACSSAYTSTARVARDKFRWICGAEKLTAYESTPGKVRRFCSVCGSEILAEWIDQPQLILRVASLDDDPGARPAVHIWTSHDVPWLQDEHALPRLPEGVRR